MWLSLLCLVLFPHPLLPSKRGDCGREKKTMQKGAVGLTCQRWRRKTPGSGRAFKPARGPRPGFARSGAAAPVPHLGVPTRCRGPTAPIPSPSTELSTPSLGTRKPPSSIVCVCVCVQFQQSTEEVGPFVPLFIDCVNVAKTRRRSRWPLPLLPPGLQGEKSPSTRLKYIAR